MNNDRDHTYSGWCCVDCLFWLANGDTPSHMTETEVDEWRADIDRHCSGSEITLGMFAEDHECATNWTVDWRARSAVRGSYLHGTVEVRADSHAGALDAAYFHNDVPAGAWFIMTHEHDLETVDDCECEQMSFSWSSCDVCGSSLGGSRDAVVFWFAPESSGHPEPEPAPSASPGPQLHEGTYETCPGCAADPRIEGWEHYAILGMAAALASGRTAAPVIDPWL